MEVSDPMPNRPVLPPNWVKMQSSATQPGRHYYFNTRNKKSVWTVEEALLPKNNAASRKPSSQLGPRPPAAEPELEDSSGSEDARRVPKVQSTFAPTFTGDMSNFPKSEDMYNQNMWTQGFNPQFMPMHPAMQNYVFGQPPNTQMPWNYPNFMFQNQTLNPLFQNQQNPTLNPQFQNQTVNPQFLYEQNQNINPRFQNQSIDSQFQNHTVNPQFQNRTVNPQFQDPQNQILSNQFQNQAVNPQFQDGQNEIMNLQFQNRTVNPGFHDEENETVNHHFQNQSGNHEFSARNSIVFNPIDQDTGQSRPSQTGNIEANTQKPEVNVKMAPFHQTKKAFQSNDLRLKLEARKNRCLRSTDEKKVEFDSSEELSIRVRRNSCPSVDQEHLNSLDASTDASPEIIDDLSPVAALDTDVPLKGESYGYWLLKEADPAARDDIVYICIDTNVFITELDCIKQLINLDKENICRILIPHCVCLELDQLSKKVRLDRAGDGPYGGMYGGSRPVNLRRKASQANSFLVQQFQKRDGKFISELNTSMNEQVVRRYNVDDGLINCCLKFISDNIHTVLLTLDKNLTIRALSSYIAVYSVEKMKKLFIEVQEELTKREMILKLNIIVPNEPKNIVERTDNATETPKMSDYSNNLPISTNTGPGFKNMALNTPNFGPKKSLPSPGPYGFQNMASEPSKYGPKQTQNSGPYGFLNMAPGTPRFGPNNSLNSGAHGFQNIASETPSFGPNKSQNFGPHPLQNMTPATTKFGPTNAQNVNSFQNSDHNAPRFGSSFVPIEPVRFPMPVSSFVSPLQSFGPHRFPNVVKPSVMAQKSVSESQVAPTNPEPKLDTSQKGAITESIDNNQHKNETKRTWKNRQSQSNTSDIKRGNKIRLVRQILHDQLRHCNQPNKQASPKKAQESHQISVSNESNSTHYPSLTTTSVISKSVVSLESSTPYTPHNTIEPSKLSENSRQTLGKDPKVERIRETRWDDMNKGKVVIGDAMREKLSLRMDEWVTQFEHIMVDMLTHILLSEKRFYIVPPPWNLHEALCTLAERCRRERKRLSEMANAFAAQVDRSCTAHTGQYNVRYTKMTPRSPEIFMKLYQDARNIVTELKKAFDLPDIQKAETLLEDMLNELQHGTIEVAACEQGQLSNDETIENTANEDDYEEDTAQKCSQNKNAQVVEFLAKHYPEWAKVVQFELKEKDRMDKLTKGNKIAVDVNEDFKRADKEIPKTCEQPVEKNNNLNEEPVIIRTIGSRLPEYEHLMENYDDSMLDMEDEMESYDENQENSEGNEDCEFEDEYVENAEEDDYVEKSKENDETVENEETIENDDNIVENDDVEIATNRNGSDKVMHNEQSSDNAPQQKICQVSVAIERAISNCFAFACEHFNTKLGITIPDRVTGDTKGLPELPAILVYIDTFARCLDELLNSRRCQLELLRSSLSTLAPQVRRLPDDDRLSAACTRFVDHLKYDALKVHVDFMYMTHTVLTKFYTDHCKKN